MNYKTVLAIFACLLLAALPAVAQKKVEFAKFQEYVGDTDHRRRGERFVVPDAPMTEKVAFIKGYQVYYFEAEDGGARQAFYT